MSLKDKTIVITGASRGIGAAMAKRFAADGANIAILAKTAEPHPKLTGTIHEVAAEVEQAGGKALPIALDVRDAAAIESSMQQIAEHFGGIDVLINNASALALKNVNDLSMKNYDLLQTVNARATYACSKFCLPFLQKAKNPHILNMSPPLSMNAKWFKGNVGYTISKYGMSMCALGMAEEFKEFSIAVNALWPRTAIATAAVEYNFPPAVYQASRKPSIVADAAYLIITQPSTLTTGQFFIDEEVLVEHGVTDIQKLYATNPEQEPFIDFYID